MAFGDRDGEPGADERALPRRQLDALARREVEPRVALVRPRRDDRGGMQPADQ